MEGVKCKAQGSGCAYVVEECLTLATQTSETYDVQASVLPSLEPFDHRAGTSRSRYLQIAREGETFEVRKELIFCLLVCCLARLGKSVSDVERFDIT